ncbi:MAG: D-alanyl-D-alanine carboxypeptidase/D-alanyl-D-alanine-endopeptidase [Verrucomicrobiales bacterium]
MRRAFTLIAFLTAVAILAVLVGGAEKHSNKKKKPPASKVEKAVNTLAAVPELLSGTLGFYFATLESPEKPLFQRNAQQGFIPASTIKAITTGAALDLLGPEFCFETTLHYDAGAGDLWIRGSGDPSLARHGWDELFDEWLTALQRADVREIPGGIIADESAWESQEIPDGWAWLDIGNYYAPALTPLAFHNNEFRLFFRLGANVGDAAEFFDADPWPAGMQFINEMRTGPPGSGDNGYCNGGPGTDRHVLRGTLPLDGEFFSIRGALPDPALFCAQQFTDWLQLREIPVHGEAFTTRRLEFERVNPQVGAPDPRRPPQIERRDGSSRPAEATAARIAEPGSTTTPILVASHLSPPLKELLIPINHRSLNLDCECLLRTLGQGRAVHGLQRVREFLAAKNLPLGGFHQADGSGLARLNMITPELLTRAVAAFVSGEHGDLFLASLPVAGESGTLEKVAANTAARGHIRAKSGHVERVKCYAGIVETASGKRLVFAIMVNNYDGSSDPISDGIDAVFEAMAEM